MKHFVLEEDQLFDKSHYPVGIIINSAGDQDYLQLIECLAKGIAYSNDGGGFFVWASLDDYEKDHIDPFEGVKFEAEFGTSVVITYSDVL